MDRRKFLVSGGAALIGLTIAACTKSKSTPKTSALPTGFNLAQTTNDLIVNTNARMGFVVRKNSEFISPVGIKLALGKGEGGPFNTALPVNVYSDTGGAPAYVATSHMFTSTGTFWIQATLNGKKTTTPVNVVEASAVRVPRSGETMVRFDSPTTANHRGVEPICTRTPACSLHDVTISQALDEHKPLAVLFATPARCQTATCGPVLDTILKTMAQFPHVKFLHEEIYVNLQSQDTTPVVNAYNMTSEPVLFLANSDGKIATRIDGLFSGTEAALELAKLT